jgi:hypothetical protein
MLSQGIAEACEVMVTTLNHILISTASTHTTSSSSTSPLQLLFVPWVLTWVIKQLLPLSTPPATAAGGGGVV